MSANSITALGAVASTPLGSNDGPSDKSSLVEKALFDQSKHHTVRVLTNGNFMLDVDDLKNPYWLVREFVQNFVDANTGENKNSLNDVRCNVSASDVEIAGNWSFERYDDLITFGTSKKLVNEQGREVADLRKAGGIGIGIKQCALSMLRDKGVESFEIQGKDWLVKYRLVEPSEINQKLKLKGITKQIQGSYFIAEVEKRDPQDSCSYRLKASTSAGKETLAAFQHFHDLGEHSDHPDLQNMDFNSEYGAIKWLGDKDSRGVLMMNGQKRSFRKDNDDGSFRGGKGLTVTIHNEIPRDFHRGPISADTLTTFLKPIVNQMSIDEAKKQLQKSFHLWSNNDWNLYDGDRQGFQVLVQELVEKLAREGFRLEDLEKLFPDTKFIYIRDGSLTKKEKASLLAAEAQEAKVLVTCPQIFKFIGVPEKTLDRAHVDHPAEETPNMVALKMQTAHQIQTVGLPVNYEEIRGLTNPAELFDLMHLRLSAAPSDIDPINGVDELGQGGRFRIYMNTNIHKDLIANQFLDANKFGDPIRTQAKYVLFLRGLAHYGVKHNVLFSQRSMLSDTLIDHTVSPGNRSTSELIIKTQNASNRGNTDFIEIQIQPEYIDEFKARFINKLSSNKFRVITIPTTNMEPQTPNPIKVAEKKKESDPFAREDLTEKLFLGGLFSFVALCVGTFIWAGARIGSNEEDKKTPPQAIVNPLDKIAQEVDKTVQRHSDSFGNNDIYKIRRDSTDKYAHRGSTSEGKSLDEFTANQHTAEVGSNSAKEETEEQKRIAKLTAMLNSIEGPEHVIENFAPVMFPSELEQHKIELLKKFMYLATGVKQDYDLFIFEGKGAYGVNMPNKGGIGLHREMLKAPINEALRELSHELGHEKAEGNYKHGDLVFYHRLGALLSATVDRLLKIAHKAIPERSSEENELIDIAKQWDELRPVEDPARIIKR